VITQYMATAGDTASLPANARLWSIQVGTAAGSAVVTVYNNTAGSGDVRVLIDASVVGSYRFYGARFPKGMFAALSGGNAKISVTAD